MKIVKEKSKKMDYFWKSWKVLKRNPTKTTTNNNTGISSNEIYRPMSFFYMKSKIMPLRWHSSESGVAAATS